MEISTKLLAQPTCTPRELLASKIMPLSRNSLYAALASGDIPSIRIGRLLVIPTAPLRKKLGLEVAS